MSIMDIELVSVSKQFGSNRIVNDIDLSIPAGQFISILGPSGCGKTTTLNMIAGFDQPTSGEIRIRGKNQAGIPPERRHIGLVFQNYALFPHMTVAENIGFGLKMQGIPRQEIETSTQSALKSVHLDGLDARYPKELSGGQQQRTALARAIAPRPSLLLLDEPLSNLDLKLREAMRVELKEIQEQLGMTFVYVTHDQEEAMAMSDQIVVMQGGVIAQQGAPADIYDNPKTTFVADFIGKSNIYRTAGTRFDGGLFRVYLEGGRLSLVAKENPDTPPGVAGFCCVRPEAVRLIDGEILSLSQANLLEGTISRIVNLGAQIEFWIEVPSGQIFKAMVRSIRSASLKVGGRVRFSIEPEAVQLLPA